MTSSAGAKFVKKSVSLKECYNCKTCVIPMIHKFPVKPIKMHLPLKYQVNWSFFCRSSAIKCAKKWPHMSLFFKFLKNCTFKAVVLRKGTSEVMIFANLMYLSTMNMLFKNFQWFWHYFQNLSGWKVPINGQKSTIICFIDWNL